MARGVGNERNQIRRAHSCHPCFVQSISAARRNGSNHDASTETQVLSEILLKQHPLHSLKLQELPYSCCTVCLFQASPDCAWDSVLVVLLPRVYIESGTKRVGTNEDNEGKHKSSKRYFATLQEFLLPKAQKCQASPPSSFRSSFPADC